MPIVKLDTGFNIEVEFPVASFIKRLTAWTIDFIVCCIITWGLSVLLKTSSFLVWTDTWSLKGLLISLPVLFYFIISEVTMNGRSIGKLAMKLRVVTEEGGQPSLGQFLIRWVFRLVDFPYWIVLASISGVLPWFCILFLFAGITCVIVSPKSQRIGDFVAGTLLIDVRNNTSWQDTVFTELNEHYKPRYPQVMQLTDRDINTLKQIIETVKKKNDQDLARRIMQRIISKVKMETDQYPIDFLETLMLDYNYYSTR